MPFFTFDQNNSHGIMQFDEEAGITEDVVVEGRDRADILERARDIGLYFDGGGDCPCCGPRWSKPWDGEDMDEVPSKYGEPDGWSKPFQVEEGKSVCIHYMDGTREWR